MKVREGLIGRVLYREEYEYARLLSISKEHPTMPIYAVQLMTDREEAAPILHILPTDFFGIDTQDILRPLYLDFYGETCTDFGHAYNIVEEDSVYGTMTLSSTMSMVTFQCGVNAKLWGALILESVVLDGAAIISNTSSVPLVVQDVSIMHHAKIEVSARNNGVIMYCTLQDFSCISGYISGALVGEHLKGVQTIHHQ